MKIKLILVVLTFCASALRSQIMYSFAKVTEPYSDLAGNDLRVITAFDPNTGLHMIHELDGETFKIFGKDYTFGGTHTIAMGEYPFLRIDDDSTIILTDAIFTFLDSIDLTSRKSFIVEGNPGEYVLKLEYRNFHIKNGPVGNFISVQIWLHQKTGVIEIHFGPRSSSNSNAYTITNGPNSGIIYCPDDFSSCYSKIWCHGTPPNTSIDSSATLVFNCMGGIPAEGTVFRFIPRFMPVSTVGILEEKNAEVPLLFPNPANETLFVKGNDLKMISLFSPDGKMILEQEPEDSVTEICLNELPNGVYLLRFEKKSGNVLERKISLMH